MQGKAAAPPCPIGVSDRRGVLAFRVAPSCGPRQLEESREKGPVNYRLRQSDVLWNLAEVEETLKRIQSQKGVQGIIVVNSEGIPIKSTMDNTTTIQYAGLMHSFIMKARSTVRDIDPQNDLTFLRIRSKKNEIMVAPGKRKESESRCQSIQQILLVMSVRVACWFLCGRDAVS